ncbi:hypothetical protein FQN50_006146 [Emmonsiellopsis sp. PD_5]|nr:hypothetical protein FQN50_006146 [Emmonsiellopsis sp. PD_5]
MAGKDGDKANPPAEDKGKGKASSTPQERTPGQSRSAPGDINAQILQIQRRAEQVRQSISSRPEQPSSSNSAANPRSPATTASTKTTSTSSRSSAGPRSPAVGAASGTPADRDVTSNTAVAVSESGEAPRKKKRKTRRGKKKRKTPPEVDGQTTVNDGSGSESDEASVATTEPALSAKAAGKRPMRATEGSNGSTATPLAGADLKGDSGVIRDISNGVSTPMKKEEQKATQPETSGSGNGAKSATNEAAGKDDQSPVRSGSVGAEEEALTALGSGKGPTYAGIVRRSSRMGVPANRQEEPIDETSILSMSRSSSSSGSSSGNAVSKDDTSRRSGENDEVDAEQKKLLARYRKEIENLREQLEGQSTDLLRRNTEICDLKTELSNLRGAEGDLQQRIKAQDLLIAAASKDNSQLKEDLADKTTSLANVIKDVKEKSKIVDQIEKEMEHLRDENNELKKENKANLARFDKYEAECTKLMSQVVNSPLRAENAQLKSENEEVKAELNATRQHLQDLQAEQADLRKLVRNGNGKRKPSALSQELAELGSKKEEVDEAEKSTTETKADARAPEVKDALVQTTEQVIASPRSRLRRFLMIIFIIVVWVMIILWGQDEESLWLEANDISRAAFVGTRDRTLGPFPWLETLRFDLIVWIQIDRVLPG